MPNPVELGEPCDFTLFSDGWECQFQPPFALMLSKQANGPFDRLRVNGRLGSPFVLRLSKHTGRRAL